MSCQNKLIKTFEAKILTFDEGQCLPKCWCSFMKKNKITTKIWPKSSYKWENQIIYIVPSTNDNFSNKKLYKKWYLKEINENKKLSNDVTIPWIISCFSPIHDIMWAWLLTIDLNYVCHTQFMICFNSVLWFPPYASFL